MYVALTDGSTTGKSGVRYSWNAGQEVDAPKGDLDHVKGMHWDDNAGPLPDDLPGRDALMEAGIETIGEIEALEDPTDIDGIGDATAQSLAKYLSK